MVYKLLKANFEVIVVLKKYYNSAKTIDNAFILTVCLFIW